MRRRRPDGVVLVVGGAPPAVRESVAQFLVGRGWRVHERAPGRLEVETGSVRRSVLLGAFAGRRFHLASALELREVPGAVELRWRWGARAGRALGGAAGRARAARVHGETADALAQHLRAQGRPVRIRPL